MVRGPRRGVVGPGGAPTDAWRRRAERKAAKLAATTHSATANGWVGRSIIETLEDRLTDVCALYRSQRSAAKQDAEAEDDPEGHTVEGWIELERNRGKDRAKLAATRGEIRGIAVAIALMRHPTKAYSEPWWKYVKKLEARHTLKAKQMMEPVDA